MLLEEMSEHGGLYNYSLMGFNVVAMDNKITDRTFQFESIRTNIDKKLRPFVYIF